jgi:hypothetical protein
MSKFNPKSFVAKFFGHEQASVKITHNPNSVRGRFFSAFRAQPEMVFGWAVPRSKRRGNWRKSLIFINKNLPTYFKEKNRKRAGFEVEYTKVHELAHVYAQRVGKVADQMHEVFADLVALEYFAQTQPVTSRKITLMAKFKTANKRMFVDSTALKIHALFNALVREEIINDIIEGRIRKDGPEFDDYLITKAKQHGLSKSIIEKIEKEKMPF